VVVADAVEIATAAAAEVEIRTGRTVRPEPSPREADPGLFPRRHGITKGELKISKRVAMLNPVGHPEHFVFILNTIRLAAQDCTRCLV
jgi:hypothetical protein